MPTPEDIEQQQQLLAHHRATLAHYLGQRAKLGEAYEPPGVSSGIAEARAEVQRIKSVLRGWDVKVEDLPDDAASPSPRRAIPPPHNRFWPFGRRGEYIPDPEVTRHNRQVFINDMRRRYEERLASAPKIIRLRLAERASAVEPPGELVRPYDIARRRPGKDDELLPARTRLLDLYDEHNAQLLILGAPGAGKTFLLYELARDLAERADTNERAPVPVIFSLAAWQPEQTLDAWMIADLSRRYGAKSQLIAYFMDTGMILPLLDGLDEVATPERRKACVNAIDVYRQSRDLLAPPLVVACREREYQDLPALKLNTGLVVQPVAPAQIRSYLAGSAFEGLRTAIENDPGLADMARTPLLLGLMAETYRNRAPEFPSDANTGTLREIVLSDYVAHCCAPRANDVGLRVPMPQLQNLLHWLAYEMILNSNQQDFYIESLQPMGLPEKEWRMWGFSSMICIFLVSCLFVLSMTHIVFIWIQSLFLGAVLGVICAILYGFSRIDVIGNLILPRRVMFEILVYIWPICLIIGFIINTFAMASAWLLMNARIDLMVLVRYGLQIGSLLGLTMTIIVIASGNIRLEVSERHILPNQNIHQSIFSGVIAGLIFSPLFALLLGFLFSVIYTFFAGFILGLSVGFAVSFLNFGGATVIKHYLLRIIITRCTPVPFRIDKWLEEAHMRGLLVRVGGGYRFYHELLQRHFAAHAEPGFPRVPILAEAVSASSESAGQAQ